MFAGGLAVATCFLMLRAVAHAGFSWDTEIAVLCLLGAFLGCLVRPALSLVYRQIRSRSPDEAKRNPG
ncbi:hypothetical protein CO669_05775 [Bradyrhizobium sp. Y36]|uniref:hypothetical protein n=1 Tax=Bradyrhizobium sp. Y36 TaxID=2035447 RepID=UPI000BE99263|nr:hypothetical protein [Bradyrhizobium sp. Y36]PDT91506.1 hypothetical protein CO669_05775 [Bradyrhizobium sp. Y36]